MRLEQRQTGSRRRLGGREEGAANMGRLGESGIKGVSGAASGLGPAGSRNAPHGLGLSRAESRGRGRRWRAAPRHPARARMAAGTGLGFGPQSIDRLHLRQGGAEDGKDEPNHAFHAKAGIALGGDSRNGYSAFANRLGPDGGGRSRDFGNGSAAHSVEAAD